MGQFKSNHQIGCALRKLKKFGFGEEQIKQSSVAVVMAVTKDRLLIPIHVSKSRKRNLSELELSELDDEQLHDVN